jgi:GrpB-like predicted nucleotidyltransferase (UPF0157 family)
MSLGLESNRVVLLRAHAEWAREFAEESRRISEALHPHILAIEHVGSTAVPDVPAKPVLDIMIGVGNFEQASVCVVPMERLGYEYRGEHGIARRHYFVKGSPRTHHVHMVEMDAEGWRTTIGFRDALLAQPGLARQYAEAKLRLAGIHANDRDGYQQAKGRVIEQILEAYTAR